MPDTVLITRPEPGASETAVRVAAMGLLPLVAPLLEIDFPPPRLPAPETIDAILMASGNAAEPLPAALHGLPVLTVGAATARRARAAGFRDVTSADGDAAALVALVRERFGTRRGMRSTSGGRADPEDPARRAAALDPAALDPAALDPLDDGRSRTAADASGGAVSGPPGGRARFLLAAGEGQSLALAADLRALGHRVARRVVYAARPVRRLPDVARQALLSDKHVTVLFFSAETARHFMRLVRAAGLLDACRKCDATTIGTPAAVALSTRSWRRVRVAGRPTQDEMLALLR